MKKIICTILSLCLFPIACIEDNLQYFPKFQVNFQINLVTDGRALVELGGYYEKKRDLETERVGYGGVLVYHTILDSYTAFDRACPVDVPEICLISAPNDKGIVTCNKCGSTFNIFYGNGNPESGPAINKKRILKPYKTSLSGTKLNVYN